MFGTLSSNIFPLPWLMSLKGREKPSSRGDKKGDLSCREREIYVAEGGEREGDREIKDAEAEQQRDEICERDEGVIKDAKFQLNRENLYFSCRGTEGGERRSASMGRGRME
ncbi:hypothetical protein OIU84_005356 [Salix udensis]|uniref:Uncharacterized protein n=1 Tax=Salix udensis TaxID=889485 RepID=A0AAD6JW04_9ROSI|nr:hypothetical protein OIU84_005356 [Salix udensis]